MTILPITAGLARDELYMRESLREALSASARGEVPVGAIVVLDGRIVGRGFNRPIGASDPTAHAEIVAIREAAVRTENYRLTGAELFVTLEPCLMCLGAAVHARIGRIVFGARDPRVGASSFFDLLQSAPGTLNHRVAIEGGVREAESAAALRGFFEERRRTAPRIGIANGLVQENGPAATLAGPIAENGRADSNHKGPGPSHS